MAAPPSLRDHPLLADPAVRSVLEALDCGGDRGRIVGGAVRDALMGRTPREVDFATTAVPAVVEGRAVKAGFRVIPTGVDHGTLTLVRDGRTFEVTTLREDVETDGRHAVVRFGRDWDADAARRDFTINALSADADGTVHDPVGGYADILAHTVRFIGDPDRRIAEDRLRVLRLFRFHAELGEGLLDRAGYLAAIHARHGLRELAPERIAQEMRRLVVAPGAAAAATAMQDGGILPLLLAGIGYPAQLRRLAAFEAEAGIGPAVPRRLAALIGQVPGDAERVAARLRLSNAEREAMAGGLAAAIRLRHPPDEDAARAARYRLGPRFQDGIALAAAVGPRPIADYVEASGFVAGWTPPTFPVDGTDIIAAGVLRGPQIGAVLSELEAWWIERRFLPDRPKLLERLQQTIVQQQ